MRFFYLYNHHNGLLRPFLLTSFFLTIYLLLTHLFAYHSSLYERALFFLPLFFLALCKKLQGPLVSFDENPPKSRYLLLLYTLLLIVTTLPVVITTKSASQYFSSKSPSADQELLGQVVHERLVFESLRPLYFMGKWSFRAEGVLRKSGQRFVMRLDAARRAFLLELYEQQYPRASPLLQWLIALLLLRPLQPKSLTIDAPVRLVAITGKKAWRITFANLPPSPPSPPPTSSKREQVKKSTPTRSHRSPTMLHEPSIKPALAIDADARLLFFKNWKKTFGHSMGANLFLAMLHGEHHSSALDYVAQRFGLSHLLAISGMHIVTLSLLWSALLQLLLFFVSRIVPLPRFLKDPKYQQLLVLLLLYLYVLSLTAQKAMASVMRAFFMRAIWTLYQLLERRYDPIHTWALALSFHGLFLPQELLSLSAALSYGASFALITLTPKISLLPLPHHSPHHSPPSPLSRLYGFATLIWEGTLVQLTVLLVTLPLVLAFTGRFSLISIPINCILAPAAMLLLTIGSLLFFCQPYLPQLLTPLCKIVIVGADTLLLRLGALPRTLDQSIHLPFPLEAAILYMLLLFLLVIKSRAALRCDPETPKQTQNLWNTRRFLNEHPL